MAENNGEAGAGQFYFDGTCTFNGEDKTYSSVKWAQDIEDNAEVFGWTERQKLVIARRSLCGTAGLWVKTEKVFKSYEELKNALIKEFPEAINSKEMHELMAVRKKRKDETYFQYMLIMKELGKRAKFPDYVAIQYIIDGIEDSNLNKMVLYGVTTYSVLKDKLAIYEKIKGETKKEAIVEVAEKKKFDASTSSRRCYNCGESTHVSAQCLNGLKCFRCNEYGHIGIRCPVAGQRDSETKSERSMRTQSVKQSAAGPTSARVIGGGAPQSVKQCSVVFGTTTGMTSANENECRCSGHDNETSTSNFGNPEVMQIVNNDTRSGKSVQKPVKTVVVASCFSSLALIDSGSDVNLISAESCGKLTKDRCNDGGSLTLTGLGRSQVKSLGKITTGIAIDGQVYDSVVFHIVPKDSMLYDITIGHEFLKDVTMVMSDGSVNIFRDKGEWLSNVNDLTGQMESLVERIKLSQVKQAANDSVSSYHPVQTKEAPLALEIVSKDEVPISQPPRRLSCTTRIPRGNTQVERIDRRQKKEETARLYHSDREKLRQKAKGQIITKVHNNGRYDVEKVDSATEGPTCTSIAVEYMKRRWPDGVT